MILYVASSFQNILEVRAVQDVLRGAGHQISHDWTSKRLDPEWPTYQQEEFLQRCGAEDYQGVINADALVLVNHAASRDAMAEFGIALGLERAVFVLYPERRSSVFFHMARLCSSIPDLLAEL